MGPFPLVIPSLGPSCSAAFLMRRPAQRCDTARSGVRDGIIDVHGTRLSLAFTMFRFVSTQFFRIYCFVFSQDPATFPQCSPFLQFTILVTSRTRASYFLPIPPSKSAGNLIGLELRIFPFLIPPLFIFQPTISILASLTSTTREDEGMERIVVHVAHAVTMHALVMFGCILLKHIESHAIYGWGTSGFGTRHSSSCATTFLYAFSLSSSAGWMHVYITTYFN